MHSEMGEETPCSTCPMPQEMRHPENRTKEAKSDIIRIMELYSILNKPMPEIIQRWAVDAVWPNMTREDRATVVVAWPMIGDIFQSLQSEAN